MAKELKRAHALLHEARTILKFLLDRSDKLAAQGIIRSSKASKEYRWAKRIIMNINEEMRKRKRKKKKILKKPRALYVDLSSKSVSEVTQPSV